MKSPISPVFSASLWIILEKGTVKDRRKTVAVRWGKAHQRVLRCLKVTNICENGEKSSKQITCCNDQKSTVARKGKSPALQRGLMNIGAGLGIENFFYHIDINIIYLVWLKMYPQLYPQSLLISKGNHTRDQAESTEGKYLAIISLILSISSSLLKVMCADPFLKYLMMNISSS